VYLYVEQACEKEQIRPFKVEHAEFLPIFY
jgi:hypothetical protein